MSHRTIARGATPYEVKTKEHNVTSKDNKNMKWHISLMCISTAQCFDLPFNALNSSLSTYFLQSISICGGIFHISVGVCELWHSICQLQEWHAQSDNFWGCHTVWPVCSRVSVHIQVLHWPFEMAWTELLEYLRSSQLEEVFILFSFASYFITIFWWHQYFQIGIKLRAWLHLSLYSLLTFVLKFEISSVLSN